MFGQTTVNILATALPSGGKVRQIWKIGKEKAVPIASLPKTINK